MLHCSFQVSRFNGPVLQGTQSKPLNAFKFKSTTCGFDDDDEKRGLQSEDVGTHTFIVLYISKSQFLLRRSFRCVAVPIFPP